MWQTNPPKPRSYRIVGDQQQVDERNTPHPRVERGELGDRLVKWRETRAGQIHFGEFSASAAATQITVCN